MSSSSCRHGGGQIGSSVHGRAQREPSAREILAREAPLVEQSDPRTVVAQSAHRRIVDRVPNAPSGLWVSTKRRVDGSAICIEKIINDASSQSWFHGKQIFCIVDASRSTRDDDCTAELRQAVGVLEARDRMI